MLLDYTLVEDEPYALALYINEVEPVLKTYLRDDCLLDSAGIERVMPLLRKAYRKGFRMISCGLSVVVSEEESARIRAEGAPMAPPLEFEHISNVMAQLLGDVQMSMMYGLAHSMAVQDERIYPRPRN